MPDKVSASQSSDGQGSLIRDLVGPQELSGMLEIEDQAEEKIAAGFGNLQNFTVATNVYSQTFPILLPYTVGEHAHQALFQHIYCDGSVCRPRAAIRKK